MLALLQSRRAWMALATLTLLEIVLGVDNIDLAVDPGAPAAGRAPARARIIGLSLAMLTRLALLFSVVWLTGLTRRCSRVLQRRDFRVAI